MATIEGAFKKILGRIKVEPPKPPELTPEQLAQYDNVAVGQVWRSGDRSRAVVKSPTELTISGNHEKAQPMLFDTPEKLKDFLKKEGYLKKNRLQRESNPDAEVLKTLLATPSVGAPAAQEGLKPLKGVAAVVDSVAKQVETPVADGVASKELNQGNTATEQTVTEKRGERTKKAPLDREALRKKAVEAFWDYHQSRETVAMGAVAMIKETLSQEWVAFETKLSQNGFQRREITAAWKKTMLPQLREHFSAYLTREFVLPYGIGSTIFNEVYNAVSNGTPTEKKQQKKL